MSRKASNPPKATGTLKEIEPKGDTATAERFIEGTGSTIKLLFEAQPNQQVRIIEYHRRREGETRFQRAKGEEGQVLPFHLLKLQQPYEQLFPQGTLFDATD